MKKKKKKKKKREIRATSIDRTAKQEIRYEEETRYKDEKMYLPNPFTMVRMLQKSLLCGGVQLVWNQFSLS